MAELTLLIGGARSGKSRLALALAEALPGPRVYLATGRADDPEMAARIARHRADRAGRGWETLEAPLDLPAALATTTAPVVLLDCLTLWLTNHMLADESLDEDGVEPLCRPALEALAGRPGTVIAVTNEVGWGIVPANTLARRFRDLAGRVNATFAAAADRVVLVVAGLPLVLKGPAWPAEV